MSQCGFHVCQQPGLSMWGYSWLQALQARGLINGTMNGIINWNNDGNNGGQAARACGGGTVVATALNARRWPKTGLGDVPSLPASPLSVRLDHPILYRYAYCIHRKRRNKKYSGYRPCANGQDNSHTLPTEKPLPDCQYLSIIWLSARSPRAFISIRSHLTCTSTSTAIYRPIPGANADPRSQATYQL